MLKLLKATILLMLVVIAYAQIKDGPHLHRHPTCPEKMHPCELNDICVSSDLLCDGLDHCGNNRDEANCSFLQHMKNSTYRRELLIRTLQKLIIFTILLALVKTLSNKMKCFHGRRQYRSASFYFGQPDVAPATITTPVFKQDPPPAYDSIMSSSIEKCSPTLNYLDDAPPSYKKCVESPIKF